MLDFTSRCNAVVASGGATKARFAAVHKRLPVDRRGCTTLCAFDLADPADNVSRLAALLACT